jgi:predicted TIM-barrel fold metal-dependent hydrolase
MELPMKSAWIVTLMLALGVAARGQSEQDKAARTAPSSSAGSNSVSGPFSDQELREFQAVAPIDAHTHVLASDPAFYTMLDRLNLHVLDIVLVDDTVRAQRDLATESTAAWNAVHGSNGRIALCTSFDPFKLNEPRFAANAIRELNQQFSQGAIAVKIYKNLGMEIKDVNGNYILPDNQMFAPIFKDIAAHRKTLIAHLADPDQGWEALDPAKPAYSYFAHNSPWYMYTKPNAPSKEEILQSRDRILARNPKLRMVGAHLGSMEADFQQLDRDLDRYPNFAVDTAFRVQYMASQPREAMIAFIIKHQNQLLYGTDNSFYQTSKVPQTVSQWEETYARDWRFFSTDDVLDFNGGKVRGLALPDPVLRKLYHDNAVRWFPGVVPRSH